MVDVPTFVWIVAAAATGLTVLGFISALATDAQHETGLHLLRSQVIELRCVYLRKMIEAYGLEEPDDSIEVMFADEVPPEHQPDAQDQPAAAA